MDLHKFTREHDITLQLTREEFVHIMGSISQDDVEYCICPDPLKNYLHAVAIKHDARDSFGQICRIGW